MSERRYSMRKMRKYNVVYEDFKTAFDPYVTPGTGYTTVIALNKEHAKRQVEDIGREVISVTRDE